MIRALLFLAPFALFGYVEWQIGGIYDILEKVVPTVEEPSPAHTKAER